MPQLGTRNSPNPAGSSAEMRKVRAGTEPMLFSAARISLRGSARYFGISGNQKANSPPMPSCWLPV